MCSNSFQCCVRRGGELEIKIKKIYGVRTLTTCPTCNTEFTVILSAKRKFCSPKCIRTGGPREGSGFAKTGYYRGIYCGSTYELAFVIWNLDQNIKIDRCKDSFEYEFDGKKHRYYPDFVIDNKIYEIKGRIGPIDFVKIKAANAILIDKDKMKKYIDYTAKTYKVSKTKLYELYE